MSDETSTVRILDADPEQVVSVTVGELQNLCKWAYGCGHDFVGMSDATVHERTCHMIKTLSPMYGSRCSRCGGGVMGSVDFCPVCGARVVDE